MAEQRGSAVVLAVSILGSSAVLWAVVLAAASRTPAYAPPLDPPAPRPATLEPEPEPYLEPEPEPEPAPGTEAPPAPRELPPSHPEAPRTPLGAEEFKRLYATWPGSSDRAALIRRLSPDDEASFALLVEVLQSFEWHQREVAIEVLAARAAELRPRLEALTEARGNAVVREGVLLACGKSGDRSFVPLLLEQLASNHWKVKRAAAWALAELADPRALEPLLRAWEAEERPLVARALREALAAILGGPVDGDAVTWRRWLERHGAADTAHRPAPVEVRELERVVDGVRFRVRLRGRGSFGVLVLPDLELDAAALEPAYEPLDAAWRTALVTLPLAPELGLPTRGPTLPYPVERVVAALGKLVDALARDEEAFTRPHGVVAHGLAGWVSILYSARNPKRVRRQVLVAVPSCKPAALDGIERLRRLGAEQRSLDVEQYAAARLPGWTPAGDEDEAAATRARWTTRLADYRDLQLRRWLGPLVVVDGRARFERERRTDGLELPDFSLFLLPRVATPTLVIYGARGVVQAADDSNAVGKHYHSAGRIVPFPNSADAPHIEEHDKYCEILGRFTAPKAAAPVTTDAPPATTEAR